MLFSNSCHHEPSLVTAASRDTQYVYDDVHFVLRRFLEDEVYASAGNRVKEFMRAWRKKSESPMCELDSAVLALSQHYGLPSHGLDVTSSLDVAAWFAVNWYINDKTSGTARYELQLPSQWPDDQSHWPVMGVGEDFQRICASLAVSSAARR